MRHLLLIVRQGLINFDRLEREKNDQTVLPESATGDKVCARCLKTSLIAFVNNPDGLALRAGYATRLKNLDDGIDPNIVLDTIFQLVSN